MIDALLGNRREGGPRDAEAAVSTRATSASPPSSPTASSGTSHGSTGRRPRRRQADRADLPPALAAARIGVYQLLFTPSVPAYAAVSASVDLARTLAPQTAGFVNWLLRRVGPEARRPPQREDYSDATAWLAALHSFPHWMVRRWVKRLGEAERRGCSRRSTSTLRPTSGSTPAREPRRGRRRPRGGGLRGEPGRYAPVPCTCAGRGADRDGPLSRGRAVLPGRILPARRAGPRAAPASASSTPARASAASRPSSPSSRATPRRSSRSTRTPDGSHGSGTTRAASAPPASSRAAATCSTRRPRRRALRRRADRRPVQRARHDPPPPGTQVDQGGADPKRLAEVQLRLLLRAADLLVPGGRIVFSTCSTEPEEGEEVDFPLPRGASRLSRWRGSERRARRRADRESRGLADPEASCAAGRIATASAARSSRCSRIIPS